MIPLDVRLKINQYLGNESKPYLIQFFGGDTEDYGCEYWDLPLQKEEDKPTLAQYQDVSVKLADLIDEDKSNPQIEILTKKAYDLLTGISITQKHGVLLVSPRDFLVRDKLKGIRKEWWDLHSQLENSGVCIFQGYRSDEAELYGIADILIAMPSTDQYDFLRMNSTRGNNYDISTEQIIKSLKRIEKEFGVFIISAQEDSLEFIFRNPIEDKDKQKIRQRLYRLCPDAENLTENIKTGRIFFWWD